MRKLRSCTNKLNDCFEEITSFFVVPGGHPPLAAIKTYQITPDLFGLVHRGISPFQDLSLTRYLVDKHDHADAGTAMVLHDVLDLSRQRYCQLIWFCHTKADFSATPAACSVDKALSADAAMEVAIVIQAAKEGVERYLL